MPTSVALTPSSAFVSTKGGRLLRFDRATLKPTPIRGNKVAATPEGHKGDILDVAASEDGKWLVTGGRDKIVGVWDVSGEEGAWVTGMKGHKDAVTVSRTGEADAQALCDHPLNPTYSSSVFSSTSQN